MKKTLFKKIILLLLATVSFSSLLQSTPTTDLTNDLNATTPDLVKTLKDGIALRNYYISAGQPQLFTPYEVKLEEFFYKNLGMPFDSICDIMEKKKMSAEEVISYVNSNQVPTNNKGSQAMENFYSSTTSAIANNPNFKNTKVVIDTTPTDTSINDNATATLNVIDLSGCFANFYSTIISEINNNSAFDSWNITTNSEITSDLIKENTTLLNSALSNFDAKKTGVLLSSLRSTLYSPIKKSTFGYLNSSEMVFDDGSGSNIDISSGDASKTGYLKDYDKYKEFVADLLNILKDAIDKLLKDDTNYSNDKQKWFDEHTLEDTSKNGLRETILAIIKKK